MSARFQQGLSQTQRQELELSQRMLQAIRVLELPAGELEGYLLEAFEGNEALELTEAAYGQRARSEGPAPGRRAQADATERHDEWLQSQPAPSGGLAAQALMELALSDVDPRIEPWVRYLINSLDGSGYLSQSDAALLQGARDLGLAGGDEELGRAIALLQTFEPRGIGGRNAIEALLLQLDPGDPDYNLLCHLLEDFLEDLARNKLPAIARELGIELDYLEVLVARLRELDLRPARAAEDSSTPRIHPDVCVRPQGGGFVVDVEGSGLGALSLDPGVSSLARDRRLAPGVRRRLQAKVDQARWLIGALEQRKETLLRVAAAVFAHQEPFLRGGLRELRPLRMGEVAEWLGMHTSTVSRAVAGKHADTPHGIFPLRSFFPPPAVGGGDEARERVRELVGAIVASEDKREPLSDDAIVAELGRRGRPVARRTVAKYRAELGIASSYQRRRFG
jgi:RNA polymerase sigma-54 factor